MDAHDLTTIVTDVVNYHKASHPRRIDFIAPESPNTCVCDAHQMTQMLNNLLTNALKYSPSQKAVTVRLYVEANEAVIEVKDQGIGIPDNELAAFRS